MSNVECQGGSPGQKGRHDFLQKLPLKIETQIEKRFSIWQHLDISRDAKFANVCEFAVQPETRIGKRFPIFRRPLSAENFLLT